MNETKVNIPPLSMHAITARLFTHVEKSVADQFGEAGKKLIQQGVENFWFQDAEEIAIDATAKNENHILFDYIPAEHQAESKYKNMTIYARMAKLFAAIAKAVVDEY